MRHTLPYLALVAVGAASGGLSSQTAPVAPCAIPGVGTPDSVWHQVRASGFTFCVPPAWRPAGGPHDSIDAKQWHGGKGSLTWDLGHPRSFTGRDVVLKITGRIVRGMPGTNPSPIPEDSHLCSPLKTTTLTQDGVTLFITELECQRQWTITAWSRTPAIYVQGEGFSDRVADQLRRIPNTIRFPSRGQAPPQPPDSSGRLATLPGARCDSTRSDSPADSTIIPLDSADVPPRLLSAGSYLVPDSLRHTDARTVLELVIDRTGKLDPCHIRVVEETASAWTEVVLNALKELQYSPAQRNGLAVAVRVTQPFHNAPAP